MIRLSPFARMRRVPPTKRVCFTLLTAFCLLATLDAAVPAWAQLADSAWPDYGGGYANQHRSPNRGPSSSASVLWSYDLQAIPTSRFMRGYHQPILLPDGTIVLNTADSSDDQIVAMNPDGTLRWYVDDSSLGPWLAADQNEQIYTIRHTSSYTRSARLRAVDFEGNPRWSTSLSGGMLTQNGPAVGRDGHVYASVDHASLNAISGDGIVSWTSASSGYYVNPAVAVDGTVYIGGNNVTALTPDGTVDWTYPVRTTYGRYPKYLSPAIGDNGTIFAGQINFSNLVALASDGSLIWSREDLDGAPSVGTNGDVYVVPESGVLHALNPMDGSTRWTYPTGKTDYYNSEGLTIDVDGNLYICNEEGVLMSLAPDGQSRWSLDLAPDLEGFVGTSAPVIGDDHVLYIVGGNTGKVFAVAPEYIPFSLDIKPGSDENPLNLKSKGVLPVSILSTDEFDALSVDLDTLLFGDPLLIDAGSTAVSPIRFDENDVNDDGLLDLTLFFSVADMVENGVLGSLSEEASLTGALLDGTEILGSDMLRIVPKPKGNVLGAIDEAEALALGGSASISPIPEPSTLALLCMGVFGLFTYSWRRRK